MTEGWDAQEWERRWRMEHAFEHPYIGYLEIDQLSAWCVVNGATGITLAEHPEVPCENCDGRLCMDCVLRIWHDECDNTSCPGCHGAGHFPMDTPLGVNLLWTEPWYGIEGVIGTANHHIGKAMVDTITEVEGGWAITLSQITITEDQHP